MIGSTRRRHRGGRAAKASPGKPASGSNSIVIMCLGQSNRLQSYYSATYRFARWVS